MNIKLFWSRDGYLRLVEDMLDQSSRECDRLRREADELAAEVREIDEALKLLRKDRVDAEYWRNQYDRERADRMVLQDKLDITEVLKEQAEESLSGARERIRELERSEKALKQQNTTLQLSTVGQLLAQIALKDKQLATQENLIARLEGREEQAVKP